MDFLPHFSCTVSTGLSFFNRGYRLRRRPSALTAGSVSGVGGRASGRAWPQPCALSTHSPSKPSQPQTGLAITFQSALNTDSNLRWCPDSLCPTPCAATGCSSSVLRMLQESCFPLAQLCRPTLAHENQQNSLPSSGHNYTFPTKSETQP